MAFADYKKFQSRFLDLARQARELASEMQFGALETACQKLEARVLEERFYLAVLGEIKRGKSTLVNALLGADLLPKTSVICTAALCVIKFGDCPKAEIFYRNGERKCIDPKALSQHVTKKNADFASIDHVEIDFPVPLLRDGVVLVDTPGVNDTDEVRSRVTNEFIPRSDGVIFVLNAGQPLSNSELQFLSLGVLKYNLKKIWFVMNGIDRLADESERAQALEFCRKHLSEFLPQPHLIPISAKLALQGSLENNRELLDRSGVPAFFDKLSAELLHEKKTALFDNPLALLHEITRDLEGGLAWSEELLTTDLQKAEERAARLESETGSAQKDLDRLMIRFHSGVEALVYETANQARDRNPESLLLPLRRILQTDQPDEQKVSEISILAKGDLQGFSQHFLDALHEKVQEASGKIQREVESIVSRFDSRTSSPQAQSRDVVPPIRFPQVLVKPALGVEGRSFVSSFGRLSSLVFLLQGNVLLAGVALAAALITRLRNDDSDWVHERLTEHLKEARKQVLDRFVADRAEMALGYRAALEEVIKEKMSVVGENLARIRKFCVESKVSIDDRRTKIQTAREKLVRLKDEISILAREVKV